MSLPPGYFEDMYAGSPDPWGFRTRWYEQRKRALTVAALTRPRYTRAFEPGCSIGTLTAALAERCDAVVAADSSAAAVASARAALSGSGHVDVRRMRVPVEWPDGAFDLVVVSEIGYYLGPESLARLADRVVAALVEGGTLLACHWRHPVADYPATGDEVHAALGARPELRRAVRHVEEDFVLEVWTRGPAPSVARQEGLVG
jgi:SAM-dependent methyltransferase